MVKDFLLGPEAQFSSTSAFWRICQNSPCHLHSSATNSVRRARPFLLLIIIVIVIAENPVIMMKMMIMIMIRIRIRIRKLSLLHPLHLASVSAILAGL